MADEYFGDDYVLHEELGRGAVGVVRRATRRAGGPPLAIKIVHQELLGDPAVRLALLDEERNLRSVRHESIVDVVGVVDDGTAVALLMEFVDGPNLRTYQNDNGGTLPAGEASSIAAQIAAAVAAIHAEGLVHLDLKPENILLAVCTRPPRVKVGDFGIAWSLTRTPPEWSCTAGTPGYRAPEMTAEETPTPAADVFALGVLVTEMITGTHPVPATQAADGPSSLPEPLKGLVDRCLATNPEDRPTATEAAAEFAIAARELDGQVARLPASAPRPPGLTQPRAHQRGGVSGSHAKRRRQFIVASTALAVLLVVAIGAAAVRISGAAPSVASDVASTEGSPADGTSAVSRMAPLTTAAARSAIGGGTSISTTKPLVASPAPKAEPTALPPVAGGVADPPTTHPVEPQPHDEAPTQVETRRPSEVPTAAADPPVTTAQDPAPATGAEPAPAASHTPGPAPSPHTVQPETHAPSAPPKIEPKLLEARKGGNCRGKVVDGGVHKHTSNGEVIAVTTIYYDSSSGKNCALLTKKANYGTNSYLALTLCNQRNQCDRDWYNYPHEAGPVTVSGKNMCLSITVAALSPDRTHWTLPETKLTGLHCR